MQEAIKTVQPADIKPGMEIKIHQKIKETTSKGEEKERIQIFEGVVIQRRHGNEKGATFTVRKISHGVGVEKIFPIFSPIISKIELIRAFKARRAKLGFLRDPKFKRGLKEIK